MTLLDPEEKRKRQFLIYFPSPRDRERWRKMAKRAGMPLSRWIFETVEEHLEQEERGAPPVDVVIENRKLRSELERLQERLKELEAENWKLKNESFLDLERPGICEFSPELLEALQSGGVWSIRDLLEVLGVDGADSKAVGIIANQLMLLTSLGLISETGRGWKWI